jgi:hypothetical protein
MEIMHQDIVSAASTQMKELYHVFIRNSLTSNEYYNKHDDKSFSLFDDVNEAEIEIPDCKQIIDFTRTAYSAKESNLIHLIYEKSDGSRQLSQFKI